VHLLLGRRFGSCDFSQQQKSRRLKKEINPKRSEEEEEEEILRRWNPNKDEHENKSLERLNWISSQEQPLWKQQPESFLQRSFCKTSSFVEIV
jgi:hypothetical protein